MPPAAPAPPAPAEPTSAPSTLASTAPSAVVFDGGPWSGWWLTAQRWDDNRQAAERLGHPADTWPGLPLNYAPTDQVRSNPSPKQDGVTGRVWRWVGVGDWSAR